MTNENLETMKADAKKVVSDLGNILSHAKADVTADVEKAKAKFGHDNEIGKKAAYAMADIKADAKKAKSDIENKMAHAKVDAEKVKSEKAEMSVKIE
jgi:hypothetical protein